MFGPPNMNATIGLERLIKEDQFSSLCWQRKFGIQHQSNDQHTKTRRVKDWTIIFLKYGLAFVAKRDNFFWFKVSWLNDKQDKGSEIFDKKSWTLVWHSTSNFQIPRSSHWIPSHYCQMMYHRSIEGNKFNITSITCP